MYETIPVGSGEQDDEADDCRLNDREMGGHNAGGSTKRAEILCCLAFAGPREKAQQRYGRSQQDRQEGRRRDLGLRR